MGGQQSPAISEAVGLLERFTPDRLADLKRRFHEPEYVELFHSDIRAGESDERLSKNQLVARGRIMATALAEATELCNKHIPSVRRKLRIANAWQFVGQLTAVLGSAAIFTMLPSSAKQIGAYIAAGLALAGALVSVVAQFTVGVLNPGVGTMTTIYGKLVDCRFRAQIVEREIAMLLAEQSPDFDRLGTLVNDGNLVAQDVNVLVSAL